MDSLTAIPAKVVGIAAIIQPHQVTTVKHILFVIAIPLLLIALVIYRQQPGGNVNLQVIPAKNFKDIPLTSADSHESSHESQIFRSQRRAAVYNETMARLHRESAETAKKMDTNEMREGLIRDLENVKPAYYQMFSKLDIDQSKYSEVFAIIRQRYINSLELLISDPQREADEIGDHNDDEKVQSSLKKSLGSSEAVELAADVNLMVILGPQKLEALKELEKLRRIQNIDLD